MTLDVSLNLLFALLKENQLFETLPPIFCALYLLSDAPSLPALDGPYPIST